MEQKNVSFCMIHSPRQIDYCHYDLGDFKGVSGVLRMITAPGSQDLHREIQIGTLATTLWSNQDRKGGRCIRTVAGEMQCPQCRWHCHESGSKARCQAAMR